MARVLLIAVLAAALYGVHLKMRPAAPQVVRLPAAVASEPAVDRGRAVYLAYGCASCHGTDGKGGFANTNAETDGKVPGVIYVAEGYTRTELGRKILDGLATVGKKDPNGPRPPYRMPGWRDQMTSAELGDLVEFLFSLYPKSESQSWR